MFSDGRGHDTGREEKRGTCTPLTASTGGRGEERWSLHAPRLAAPLRVTLFGNRARGCGAPDGSPQKAPTPVPPPGVLHRGGPGEGGIAARLWRALALEKKMHSSAKKVRRKV